MSQIAILADTHFGVRQDSRVFHDNNRKFYQEVVFPLLKKRNIKDVLHLGDVFDARVKIDVNTLKLSREYFFEPLTDFKMYVIPGNHDLYWKQSSEVTSLYEILRVYSNIYMVELGDTAISDLMFLAVPWINQSNSKQTMDTIEKSSARLVFGHLELTGYMMDRTQICKRGTDPQLFSKFNHVYSGHFHHKNTSGNITYLGSNQQHTWADYADPKGFHIYNTENHKLEFIANPYKMFEVVRYGDDFSPDDLRDCYVRIRHGQIDKQKEFDKFVRAIESVAYDVRIISDAFEPVINTGDNQTQIVENDTIALMSSMIEDKNVLDKMVDLYNKARLLA